MLQSVLIITGAGFIVAISFVVMLAMYYSRASVGRGVKGQEAKLVTVKAGGYVKEYTTSESQREPLIAVDIA